MAQDSAPPRQRDLITALRRIIRGVDLHSRALLKDYGVTAPQILVLREIARNDGRSLSSIADSIALSPATVTGILNRLEARGLLRRKRSRLDKRRIRAELTSEGRALLGDLPSPLLARLVERFEQLDEDQQTSILSSLNSVAALLGEMPNPESEEWNADLPAQPGM